MKRFSIGNKYEYCPNGNYWQEISGIFDTEVFLYCDCRKCEGQVYVLRARKFKLNEERQKELVEKLRQQNRLEQVRNMITFSNMEKIASVTKEKGEHI
jgi:hypothetical protein